MTLDYRKLEDTVRVTYANVVWSHKIQEKQADIYEKQYKIMELIRIASASITSVGIVSIIFSDQLWLKIITALISFISIFIAAFFRSFNLETMISTHKNTANDLLYIREQLNLLILRIDINDGELHQLIDQYENILEKLNEIYQSAPETTKSAVKQANKALKVDNDNTYSDLEIDRFLPEGLKREKS